MLEGILEGGGGSDMLVLRTHGMGWTREVWRSLNLSFQHARRETPYNSNVDIDSHSAARARVDEQRPCLFYGRTMKSHCCQLIDEAGQGMDKVAVVLHSIVGVSRAMRSPTSPSMNAIQKPCWNCKLGV